MEDYDIHEGFENFTKLYEAIYAEQQKQRERQKKQDFFMIMLLVFFVAILALNEVGYRVLDHRNSLYITEARQAGYDITWVWVHPFGEGWMISPPSYRVPRRVPRADANPVDHTEPVEGD